VKLEGDGEAVQLAASPASRRFLVAEVWIVLALSLGASAVYAILDLLKSLLVTGAPLNHQVAVINAAVAPRAELLDLAFQCVGIATALAPVALVAYLLKRGGESTSAVGLDALGVDARHPRSDITWGVLLAALVGGVGLAFYLFAFHLGISVDVVPTNLPPNWWRIPILILQAAEDGLLEEVVVCGYLLRRLDQLGWGENSSLVTSALLRGSYHLYQGFGGFIGNLAMGLLFGRIYQRRKRAAPLAIAHFLIDAAAFVGYVELVGRVSFLPRP
jgi:membrane protease YdiL (CAAX protease family)